MCVCVCVCGSTLWVHVKVVTLVVIIDCLKAGQPACSDHCQSLKLCCFQFDLKEGEENRQADIKSDKKVQIVSILRVFVHRPNSLYWQPEEQTNFSSSTSNSDCSVGCLACRSVRLTNSVQNDRSGLKRREGESGVEMRTACEQHTSRPVEHWAK